MILHYFVPLHKVRTIAEDRRRTLKNLNLYILAAFTSMTEEDVPEGKLWVCLRCGKRVRRTTHPGDFTGGACPARSDGRHNYS